MSTRYREPSAATEPRSSQPALQRAIIAETTGQSPQRRDVRRSSRYTESLPARTHHMATCPRCRGHLTDSHVCPSHPLRKGAELLAAVVDRRAPRTDVRRVDGSTRTGRHGRRRHRCRRVYRSGGLSHIPAVTARPQIALATVDSYCRPNCGNTLAPRGAVRAKAVKVSDLPTTAEGLVAAPTPARIWPRCTCWWARATRCRAGSARRNCERRAAAFHSPERVLRRSSRHRAMCLIDPSR